MLNYFNYFTEIEEHFQRRRGSLLMLSTLDWALIETWREAGVPLEAVLRGIDTAFDKYEARQARAKNRLRRVNGLAWCAQEVVTAVEQMMEAATGAAPVQREAVESGFEPERIAAYLEACATQIRAAALEGTAADVAGATAKRLIELAEQVHSSPEAEMWESQTHPEIADVAPSSGGHAALRVEDIERNLTVLEEKFFAALTLSAPEEELVALKEQAARELAPYRSKMNAVQLRQIEQQFLRKRLLEARKLPRLSLFYMHHS